MTGIPNSNYGFPPSAGTISGGVPLGTIIMWAGNISSGPPSNSPFFNPENFGWLVCDGRSLDCNQFYELYVTLGNLYGGTPPQNGQGTFNIPNFEGYFPRGVDPNQRIDQDTRIAQPGDTIGLAGTTQLSAVQAHTHSYTQPAAPVAAVQVGTQNPVPTNIVEANNSNAPTGAPDVSGASSGKVLVSQNETRPVNIAVYFLIKAFEVNASNI
jgi:microcystin-dependent protein